MKKHSVMLDMKPDEPIFWPDHYQHATTKLCAVELHAVEPHDTLKTILKQPLNAQLKLLSYFFSSTPRVSKILSSVPEDVIPQKKKKPRKKETNKKIN